VVLKVVEIDPKRSKSTPYWTIQGVKVVEIDPKRSKSTPYWTIQGVDK